MDGILLVGHGQAEQDAKSRLQRLAAEIKKNTEISVVHVACLSEEQPDLSAAVLSCVKQGVTRLNVVPHLLREPLLGEVLHVVRDEVESFRGMQMRLIINGDDDSSLLKMVQECLSEAGDGQE